MMALVGFCMPIAAILGDIRQRRKGGTISGKSFMDRIRLFYIAPMLGISTFLLLIMVHLPMQDASDLNDGAFIGGVGYLMVALFALLICRAALLKKLGR